ncbi:hypothetical protein DFR46_2927 [Parasphingopyxis lamellibrachiae]|uniref:Uncharacterized protein n=1 Tax=Parasphingopyxis lamellibrachiae TaxID=680125 RepID=A0A3D9F9B3_9SPHN|nr:hypothetical protein DFR46_2927 [Parasphingopyxis lamellibrachiae]
MPHMRLNILTCKRESKAQSKWGTGCPVPLRNRRSVPDLQLLALTTWPLVALPDPTLPYEKCLIFKDRKVYVRSV